VARRVLPTERARAEIDELFASDQPLAEVLKDVARLTVRLLMQTALEAEVDEFLGASPLPAPPRGAPGRLPQRLAAADGGEDDDGAGGVATAQAASHRPGGLLAAVRRWRDPHQRPGVMGDLGLGSGPVRPRHRGLLGRGARGRGRLSTSTVSRTCQRIRDEFPAWTTRDMAGVRLDYLFLDASHFKMHPDVPAEPVLAAWGIDTRGKPVFVGLAPAASESTDAWDDFLADLIGRACTARCWASATARPV
jgi:putative transposase